MDGVKPYYQALEDFIRELEDLKVTSLHLVALCADEGTHDVVGMWNAGPFEMAMAAGVLQLHAGSMYREVNGEDADEEE